MNKIINNIKKFIGIDVLGPMQRKWVDYLKAHPEQQTTSCLGEKYIDGSIKMCCLGAGGLLSGVCKWDENTLVTIVDKHTDLLDGKSFNALGLYGSRGQTFDDLEQSLVHLNDNLTSWTDIAILLETKPELYFKNRV